MEGFVRKGKQKGVIVIEAGGDEAVAQDGRRTGGVGGWVYCFQVGQASTRLVPVFRLFRKA